MATSLPVRPRMAMLIFSACFRSGLHGPSVPLPNQREISQKDINTWIDLSAPLHIHRSIISATFLAIYLPIYFHLYVYIYIQLCISMYIDIYKSIMRWNARYDLWCLGASPSTGTSLHTSLFANMICWQSVVQWHSRQISSRRLSNVRNQLFLWKSCCRGLLMCDFCAATT